MKTCILILEKLAREGNVLFVKVQDSKFNVSKNKFIAIFPSLSVAYTTSLRKNTFQDFFSHEINHQKLLLTNITYYTCVNDKLVSEGKGCYVQMDKGPKVW